MKQTIWIFFLVLLVCATSSSEAQWRWIYPSLRGEFRSCVMASADHGYILTASDSVLETRDQGKTWTTMEVEGLPTFGEFFGPSLGVLVVRDRGAGSNLLLSWHILKTTDAGQSWERLPESFGDVVDVYFGTDSLGWVTYRYGQGLHTTDGGQTWEPNAPGTPPIIRWVDRNTWYGYQHYTTEYGRKDSVLWYSFDGGKTWEPRKFTAFPAHNPRYEVKSECLSLTHCSPGTFLAMYLDYVHDPKMQSYYIQMSIARSSDSCRTWSTVYQPFLLTPKEEAYRESESLPRAFPRRFLQIRDSVVAVVSNGGPGWLLRTDDGGQNWVDVDSLFSYGSDNGGIDSDFQGNVIAVSSSRKRVQWSTDAGDTWSRRDDAEVLHAASWSAPLGTHETGLVISDDDVRYYLAISQDGSVIFDGAEEGLFEGADDLYIRGRMSCRSMNDQRALLAGMGNDNYRIYELTDSKGCIPLTPILQKLSPFGSTLGPSYYLGSGRAVVTEDNGVIYSHLENAVEWVKVDSVSESIVQEAVNQHLKFFTRDVGVCVSFRLNPNYISTTTRSLEYDVAVRTTSDGGRSWSRIYSRYQQFIQIIQASASHRSALAIMQMQTYLTGNPDGIRRTTDGGETWSLVCPTSEGIQFISAVDSLRVFATTEHDLLASHDGGQTWSHILPRDRFGNILSAGRFTQVFTTPSGFVLVCLPDGFIGGMVDSILTGVDHPEPVHPTDEIFIFPNPVVAGEDYQIRTMHHTSGQVTLTLYSSLGVRVHQEVRDHGEPGTRAMTFRTAGLVPGLYFVALNTPEGMKVGKMVVLRKE